MRTDCAQRGHEPVGGRGGAEAVCNPMGWSWEQHGFLNRRVLRRRRRVRVTSGQGGARLTGPEKGRHHREVTKENSRRGQMA